jgi:hypothetical protein
VIGEVAPSQVPAAVPVGLYIILVVPEVIDVATKILSSGLHITDVQPPVVEAFARVQLIPSALYITSLPAPELFPTATNCPEPPPAVGAQVTLCLASFGVVESDQVSPSQLFIT